MSNEQIAPSNFSEAEAVLAKSLPQYEARPEQQAFAKAVEASLASGEHLLAEAGCGVGKSLGYLIPSIIQAVNNDQRVVVSTATKALQDQIAEKDLPFLSEHLGIEFTSAILKGRSNYACVQQMLEHDTDGASEVQVHLKTNREAGGDPWSGERDDLPFEVSDKDWSLMTTTSDLCPGRKECAYGDVCYAEKAKDEAKAASITVVNHALLFTDLLVKQATNGRSSMVGEYDFLVADEAHELEDWASSSLGIRITPRSINDLGRDLANRASGTGAADAVSDAADAVSDAVTDLWANLEEGRLRFSNFAEYESEWIALATSLDALKQAFSEVPAPPRDEKEAYSAHDRLRLRARNLHTKIVDFIVSDHSALVRWVEVIKSGRSEVKVLVASPIEVGPILSRILWDHTPSVLVSATMSVRGNFDYIAGRLGLPSTVGSLIVDTPFDFSAQASLYVPTDLASPKSGAAWEQGSIEEIDQLVRASGGRALLLFTSRKAMERAYSMLAESRRPLPYKCLMQGQDGKSNKALIAEFQADTNSVLFGLRSFFTGIDVQGDACGLVVIDKLPFPVPTEPVTEARCEVIKARGGSDFNEYTIPVMSLILKQAFGRLIRHRSDRGTVAILDSRLHSGWGRKIMASLPDAKRLTDMGAVEQFYGAGDLAEVS